MKLEAIGFNRLKEILSPPAFEARLKREVAAATRINALLAEAAITDAIHSGAFAPNAALTVAMKGSSRPLVDQGLLVGSVSSKSRWDEADIGVLRKRKRASGSDANIAAIVHYGAHVTVTDRMRRYFYWLSRKNPRVKPLRSTTTVIVIPPRRYMDAAVSDDSKAEYVRNWAAAVARAMRG